MGAANKKIAMFSLRVLLVVALAFLALGAPKNGDLFGLMQPVSLYAVDAKTAGIAPIGTPLPTEVDSQALAALDAKNQIYYLIAYNSTDSSTSLLGLSLTTGAIVKNIPLPITQGAFIGVGQFLDLNPNNGHLIVTGRDLKYDDNHTMFDVDPNTGATTVLYSIGDVDLLGAASAFDSKNNIEWIQLAVNNSGQLSIDFFGVNVNTKQLVGSFPNMAYLETMNYDSQTGYIVGIGLTVVNATYWKRTLVNLDTTSQTYTTNDLPEQWSIISGSVSAFDSSAGQLSCLLSNRTDTSTFHLVTLDRNANVISDPIACTADSSCVWSMEYFNL